jgi:hypothetical protein
MGNALSSSQRRFIETFATAPSFGAEDMATGLATVESDFAQSTGAVEYPATTKELVSSVVDALFINAVEDNRIGFALEYSRRQLHAVTASNAADPALTSPVALAHTATAVRFSQTLLTIAIARHDGTPDVLRKLFNRQEEATSLHNAAITFIAQGPPSAATESLRLHAEVLLLLLTLYSTVMYHAAGSDGGAAAASAAAPAMRSGSGELHDTTADVFLDAVVYHEDPALVRMFTASLLSLTSHWASYRLSTVVQYKHGFQPSLFNLYNLFGMARREQRVDVATVLGTRALHVLCILLTYKKSSHIEVGKVNVALAAVKPSAADGGGVHRVDLTQPCLPQTVSPTIVDLLVGISRRIETIPELAVLLYVLLCNRKAEVMALLAPKPNQPPQTPGLTEMQAADLLSGLSHIAYDCVATSGISPWSFLIGTIFLQLSTETAFVTRSFSIECRAAWYKERFVGSISAGSLIITVASRTAARAVALGNHDIAELNLGMLANMAPYVNNLHMIACQRLATMLKHMLKRLSASREAVAKDSTDYDAAATLKSIEGHCCLTIDTMLGILDGSSRGNHSLLYDLLHQKPEIFGVTAQWPLGTPLADAVAPLAKLIGFYETELASFAANTSVDEVMRVIRKVSDEVSAPDIVIGGGHRRHDSNVEESGISACERNVFEYVEDEEAYEYFAPLVWRIVLQRSGTVLVFPVVRSAVNLRLLAEHDEQHSV